MNYINKIKDKAKNLQIQQQIQQVIQNIEYFFHNHRISSKTKGDSQKSNQIHPSEQFLIKTISSEDSIISVADLDKIAQETFDIYLQYGYFIDQYQLKIIKSEKYEVIIRSLTFMIEKELDSNKIIKLLIICDYLLKNGCSGCIDDFRDHLYIFKYFQKYEEQKSTEQQVIIQKKALHLCKLLEDKELLQKEKIIQNQIKRQLEGITYHTIYLANKSQIYGMGNYEGLDAPEQTSKMGRFKNLKYFTQLNDLVENYFYKYLDTMNDKLDDVTETIGVKVDQYIGYIQRKVQSHNTNKQSNEQFVDSCMGYDIDKSCKSNSNGFEPAIGTDILEFEDNPDEEVLDQKNKQVEKEQDQNINNGSLKDKQQEQQEDTLQMVDLLELEDNVPSHFNQQSQYSKQIKNQLILNQSKDIQQYQQIKIKTIYFESNQYQQREQTYIQINNKQ